MLHIPFQSEGFPQSSPVVDGNRILEVTWSDLLWAALTVGRPDLHYVFQHGESSFYEAIFRLSLVRMALQQASLGSRRLQRTPAARHLDPSEKASVSYFLGLNVCKLFAERCLAVPFVLHLDVFRDELNPAILSGKSRPDLVGRLPDGNWIVIESKGRVSPPDFTTRTKAKAQAQRLIAVQGMPLQYAIGAITYFKRNVLNFYWVDPPANNGPDAGDTRPRNPFSLSFLEEVAWRGYFQPIANLLTLPRVKIADPLSTIPIPEADVTLHIHSDLARYLRVQQWVKAFEFCTDKKMADEFTRLGLHGDGTGVEAGKSWIQPYRPESESLFKLE
jgi:hypothetical protein